MEKKNEMMQEIIKYHGAVQAIKTAILQGQYEAAKGVNRIQLAVYFAIGKYISVNTRTQGWGTHALEFISGQLRRELPGLRGFSENNLKNMRKFYEAWKMLDKTTIAIVESLNTEKHIDIQHAMVIPNTFDFPVEDFFRLPFTHHIRIIEGLDNLENRYYYIHRAVEEHLPVEKLRQLIRDKAHEHQGDMPNNFCATMGDVREARKAVMMFKDEYMLNFINIEEIGERDKIDVDERVIENPQIRNHPQKMI